MVLGCGYLGRVEKLCMSCAMTGGKRESETYTQRMSRA